jgi:hypothetical protein
MEISADDSAQQYVVDQVIGSIPNAKDPVSLAKKINGLLLKPLTPNSDTDIFWYIDIPSCHICQFEDGSPTHEIEEVMIQQKN